MISDYADCYERGADDNRQSYQYDDEITSDHDIGIITRVEKFKSISYNFNISIQRNKHDE